MKRILTMILAITMLFSFAACGTGGEPNSTPAPTGEAAPNEEPSALPTENPERALFRDVNDNTPDTVWMTDESVYYVTEPGGFPMPKIMFSDREYHDWMALCGRPDCMHRDTNCNACTDGGRTGADMYIFGDYIYYISEEIYGVGDYVEDNFADLWRMKLDGSDHEKLLHFLPEGGPLENGPAGYSYRFLGSYAIFRYYFFDASGIEDYHGETDADYERANTVYQYYAVDLREKNLELKKIFEGDYEHRFLYGNPIASRGNTVFSILNDYSTMFTDKVTTTSVLLKTDLDAGEYTEIMKLPCSAEDADGELAGDTLLIIDSQTADVYSIDTDTNECTVKRLPLPIKSKEMLIDWYDDVEPFIYMDHMHYRIYNGIIMTVDHIEDETKKTVYFYDMEGSPLGSVDCLEGGEPIHLSVYIENYLFAYKDMPGVRYPPEMFPPEWYIDLNDIGTENLMWHKWEP